jgi:hypothetical protein
MSEQRERRLVRAEQLIEHLRQILEVPENVTGATIVCEAGDCARIEWRTLATPVKDSEQ